MMIQQMPEEFVPVLTMLHRVSQENYEALRDAVDVLGQPAGIAEFADLASGSGDVSIEEAQALLSMMLSTLARADVGDLDLDELVDQMAATDSLGLGGDEREDLALRIKGLIDHRSTQVLHKSLALMREHQRIFLDTRIVTDIRPVFGGDVSEELDAVVLSHSLKIDFIEEGRRRRFDVVLDQSDLQVMQSAVERAIEKAASLRQTLESADIANFTLEA